jgi:hypothetical protein
MTTLAKRRAYGEAELRPEARPLGRASRSRLHHLPPRLQRMGPKRVAALVERYEAWATDAWAAARLFEAELFTTRIVEPGVGTGVLAGAALEAGYDVAGFDVFDWGWPGVRLHDWRRLRASDLPWRSPAQEGGLLAKRPEAASPPSSAQRSVEFSVVCNPPFSLTADFVAKALELGARKVAAFQKMEFMGTLQRRPWLAKHPPSRIWLCGTRATCWRFDVPPERRNGSTPTLHAWFVWERGHDGPPVTRNIWESS